MLHRLEIENFYSIRDRQVIDFRAADNVPDASPSLAPLWPGSSERAPKVVALFGPNGAGKSNVLKALSFLSWFAKDSFQAPRGSRLPFERFNDAEMLSKPTRLAAHFAGPESIDGTGGIDAGHCRYAYELTIGGADQHHIEKEALYYWPDRSVRRTRLFERHADGRVSAAKQFGLSGFHAALEKILRPEASVVSTLAQLEHPYSKMLAKGAGLIASNILIYKAEGSNDGAVRHFAANPKMTELFNRDIERIDFGVTSMQIDQGANGPLAFFTHKGLAHPMPMLYESHGTQQFVQIYPFILHALETGGIAILDELDSAIHPMLLPEIVRWFHDSERNPKNGQLWMSCHNASLLENLSKEEVLFCEKDNLGRSKIYGLADIQSVRRTDNYYKKYMGGAFGALPQIG